MRMMRTTCLWAAALAMVCCVATARADVASGDSTDFSMDLTSQISPPGSGDSGDFSADITGVNRGWADSGDFTIDTPEPNLVTVSVPAEATINTPFTVTVTLRNDGGPGDYGGVSISFPDLADEDGDGTIPPYDSNTADVDTDVSTTFADVGYYDLGDEIFADFSPMNAEHLLVEGCEPDWMDGQERTLKLTVTPKQLGALKVRIRGWIAGEGMDWGPPVYRDPSGSGGGREQDQQDYWCEASTVQVVRPWTVMVFMNGDNDLEDEAIDDFLEMAQVDNPNVNIVVQLDRTGEGDDRYDDWTSARRFLVTHGLVPSNGNELADLGEVNMGDPDTLSAFVNWARAAYPAEHYALIIWDHGDGWRDSAEEGNVFRSVSVDWDDGMGWWDTLSMSELHQAFDDATALGTNPIDVVDMDACMMAGLEVAYEFKDCVHYFAGSADLVPGGGNEYQVILDASNLAASTSPENWADALVPAYRDRYDSWDSFRTYMAGRMDQIDNVAIRLSNLATTLMDNLSTERANIAAARGDSREYTVKPSSVNESHYGYVVDLYEFCCRLRNLSSNAAVRNECLIVMQTVANDMLLDYWADTESEFTTAEQRCFWVYFPPDITGQYASDWANYDGGYLSFLASPDQRWDDFLRAYFDSFALTLNVVNPGSGTVDIDPNLGRYPAGTPVTLTAIPEEGKAFKHWEIYHDPNHAGDTYYAVIDANLTTTLVMDGDKYVTARFTCGSGMEYVLPLMACMLGLVGMLKVIRRKR